MKSSGWLGPTPSDGKVFITLKIQLDWLTLSTVHLDRAKRREISVTKSTPRKSDQKNLTLNFHIPSSIFQTNKNSPKLLISIEGDLS